MKIILETKCNFLYRNKYLNTCENGCSVNSSAMLLNGASRNKAVGCIFSAASRSNTCVETLMTNKSCVSSTARIISVCVKKNQMFNKKNCLTQFLKNDPTQKLELNR